MSRDRELTDAEMRAFQGCEAIYCSYPEMPYIMRVVMERIETMPGCICIGMVNVPTRGLWTFRGEPFDWRCSREIFRADDRVWRCTYGCGPSLDVAAHTVSAIIRRAGEYESDLDDIFKSLNTTHERRHAAFLRYRALEKIMRASRRMY
jgi:hypothetical protein